MRTVIFDLDGTLADTSGDLIAAANACFAAMGAGAPLDVRRDAATAFGGGRAMLRLGLDRVRPAEWTEAEVDAWYPRLLEYYAADLDRHTRLYPGVERALDRLGSGGWRLGICTNKPEALAELLVSRLGVRDRFGALIGADTLPTRKPDPAPLLAAIERAGGSAARAALVGDTVTDRETARAAGIASVLVTFGPGAATVVNLAPEGLLDHYDRIEDVLTPLLG